MKSTTGGHTHTPRKPLTFWASPKMRKTWSTWSWEPSCTLERWSSSKGVAKNRPNKKAKRKDKRNNFYLYFSKSKIQICLGRKKKKKIKFHADQLAALSTSYLLSCICPLTKKIINNFWLSIIGFLHAIENWSEKKKKREHFFVI